jgi:hypothetical protein
MDLEWQECVRLDYEEASRSRCSEEAIAERRTSDYDSLRAYHLNRITSKFNSR